MGVIGGFRGWAKELLVTFSVILALAIDRLIQQYGGPINPIFYPLATDPPTAWQTSVIVRVFLYFGLAYFGYQSPNIPALAAGKFARDKLQDWLLGSVIGLFNGYLLIGSLWFFLDQANYPWGDMILTSSADPKVAASMAAVDGYMKLMAPQFMTPAMNYFAVVLAFVFVIIVFI